MRFGRFLERSRVLPSHQYSCRNNLGTCDALLDIIIAGQIEWDRPGELRLSRYILVPPWMDFYRVNHRSLVFELQEAVVGGIILRMF